MNKSFGQETKRLQGEGQVFSQQQPFKLSRDLDDRGAPQNSRGVETDAQSAAKQSTLTRRGSPGERERLQSLKPRRLLSVCRETYRSYACLRHQGYEVYLYEEAKPVRGESSRDRRTGASRAVKVELQRTMLEVVHSAEDWGGRGAQEVESAAGSCQPQKTAKDKPQSRIEKKNQPISPRISWVIFPWVKITGGQILIWTKYMRADFFQHRNHAVDQGATHTLRREQWRKWKWNIKKKNPKQTWEIQRWQDRTNKAEQNKYNVSGNDVSIISGQQQV